MGLLMKATITNSAQQTGARTKRQITEVHIPAGQAAMKEALTPQSEVVL